MRFHKGLDGWNRDSYQIPQFAVAGVSDTGTSQNSPAPSDDVAKELEDLRVVLLKSHIQSRLQVTRSGNCCCLKKWVVVAGRDFDQADKEARRYLADHLSTTRYIHDAD